MEAQRELELKGIGVSPGIASGPVLLLKAEDAPLPEYAIPAEDVPREMVRLENALIETRRCFLFAPGLPGCCCWPCCSLRAFRQWSRGGRPVWKQRRYSTGRWNASLCL